MTGLRVIYLDCGTCCAQGRILEPDQDGRLHSYPCTHCDGTGRRPALITPTPRRGWDVWRATRAYTHRARRTTSGAT